MDSEAIDLGFVDSHDADGVLHPLVRAAEGSHDAVIEVVVHALGAGHAGLQASEAVVGQDSQAADELLKGMEKLEECDSEERLAEEVVLVGLPLRACGGGEWLRRLVIRGVCGNDAGWHHLLIRDGSKCC